MNFLQLRSLLRAFTLALLLITSSISHAGIVSFAIGYAIGSSGNKTSPEQQPILLKSDVANREVIACHSYDLHSCIWGYESISPELYAGKLGYRTIFSKSIIIIPHHQGIESDFIVMEVSK
jgi:hypothetical protein